MSLEWSISNSYNKPRVITSHVTGFYVVHNHGIYMKSGMFLLNKNTSTDVFNTYAAETLSQKVTDGIMLYFYSNLSIAKQTPAWVIKYHYDVLND